MPEYLPYLHGISIVIIPSGSVRDYRTVTNLEVSVGVVSQLGLTWVTEYTTKPER